MNHVRRAEERDIPALLNLLVQVDMVHHNGRPDLFKGPATKYSAAELAEILTREETPVFVCEDGEGRVLPTARAASAEEKMILRFSDGRVAVRRTAPEGEDGKDEKA